MSQPTVLIVDDEPDICQLLSISLERIGLKSAVAGSLAQARQILDAQAYSLCLTDMRLPDGDGLELVSHISRSFPDMPVAMITAHGNMDTAIDALKRGAFDFLTKPIDLEQLKRMVQSAISLSPVTESVDPGFLERRLVGKSRAIQELRQTICKVARSQAPVFIHGESGVGKEVCARSIHAMSGRREQAFIAVNCGAIPAELVESEFFGHKKGSFTGADKDKQGLFLSASGGSLLLDEVADLPLAMQVKLLRAIQEKSVRPIGENEELPVDVRLISASHKNLHKLVDAGQFRDDLFYRINVIELTVPPLRDRSEDIPDIAHAILTRMHKNGQPAVALTDSALERLTQYPFPGNVRELENTLERSIALSDLDTLDADNLVFQSGPVRSSPAHSPATPAGQVTATPADDVPGNYGVRVTPLDEHLQEIEKSEILRALESCRWNRTEAAKILGISFRSLRYRMKKLGLDT